MEQFIDCSNCQKDYICCTNFGVTLTKNEISKFENKDIKVVPLTENNIILGFVFVLKKKKNGSCIFFDNNDNLCNIYENRPQACRKFTCIGRL